MQLHPMPAVPDRGPVVVPPPPVVIEPRRVWPIAAAIAVWRFLGPRAPGLGLGEYPVMMPIRRHWWVPLRAGSKGVVLTTLSFILTPVFIQLGWFWILWAGMTAHWMWIGYQVLVWRADQLVITNQRLLRVWGVFTNNCADVPLSKIKGRDLHQSLPGRILGYGTLRVVAADGEQFEGLDTLEFLPKPYRVQQATL